MNNYFCSLVTKSHVPNILATFYSIYKFNNNYVLFLTIIDDDNYNLSNNLIHSIISKDAIKIVKISDIINANKYYMNIYNKYMNYTPKGDDIIRKNNKNDIMRYSMKVCLISYLLVYTNIESVIWIDCDLYFINDIKNIFEILKTKEVILTPHFRNTNNLAKRHNVFGDGFFNVGFIGFSKNSICLNWYINQVYYTCDLIQGYYYYEQKYLDYFHILTNNVEILRDGNYNLGEWNIDTCIRQIKNNELYIENNGIVSKAIFFHFTNHYIEIIKNDKENILVKKYLNEYELLQRIFS